MKSQAILALSFALAACGEAHDGAYYKAHLDQAKAKVHACTDAEMTSTEKCKAADYALTADRNRIERELVARVCALITDQEASRY